MTTVELFELPIIWGSRKKGTPCSSQAKNHCWTRLYGLELESSTRYMLLFVIEFW
jgi:hypothetical protein